MAQLSYCSCHNTTPTWGGWRCADGSNWGAWSKCRNWSFYLINFWHLKGFSRSWEAKDLQSNCHHEKAEGVICGTTWGCETPHPVEAAPWSCQTRFWGEQRQPVRAGFRWGAIVTHTRTCAYPYWWPMQVIKPVPMPGLRWQWHSLASIHASYGYGFSWVLAGAAKILGLCVVAPAKGAFPPGSGDEGLDWLIWEG